MKQLSVLLFVLFAVISVNAQTAISGTWNTGTENTIVEFKKVSGKIVGKIVSSDNSKAKKGKQIVKDVTSKKGAWKGKIYVAQKGKWADAKFVRKGDTLEVTVYSGWLSKTVKWKKVK